MFDRCPNCPCDYMPIAGSGPLESRILAIGERPGERENSRGTVFVGPSGQEWDNTYLWKQAKLQRYSIRVENAVRCWAANNRTPNDKEVRSCSSHFLPDILRECRPEIILLMGGRACLLSDRKIKIDMMHGQTFWGTIMDGLWTGWIWPMYHPALGMHDTTKMTPLLKDYKHLGEWLEGLWSPPTSDLESGERDYRLLHTAKDLVEYCTLYRDHPWSVQPAVDTERHGQQPFSVQFSIHPGTGRMFLLPNEPVVREFNTFLSEMDASIRLHNAPQDLDWLHQMGVRLVDSTRAWDGFGWSDTMQEAFQIGVGHQALKELAYQLLGVEMRTWEDVVRPASVKKTQEWLEAAYEYSLENFQDTKRVEMRTMLCNGCEHRAHSGKKCRKCDCPGHSTTRPLVKEVTENSASNNILKHVLSYVSKVDSEYDPWENLPRMWQEGLRGKTPPMWQMVELEAELGPMPILGIGNCEIEDAVQYGCSDADHTGQVADKLAEQRWSDEFKVSRVDIRD